MRVVIAPDSFKESASAKTVARALAAGVRRAAPDAHIVEMPMADGGEGTVETLVEARGGAFIEKEVTGPLGLPVTARYGLLDNGATAVIEMAAASGLALVPRDRRDPRFTTTRGTGELMADALERGVEHIILGLGGSATTDGGAGMAQALGYRLLDGNDGELEPGGAALIHLARIDAKAKHGGIEHCKVLVASDVRNPLCGEQGAARVYGPQKGATPEAVEVLDEALRHFAEIIARDLDKHVLDMAGAGAAGGLGAGLVAFAGGTLQPGVELIADYCGLEAPICEADFVLTGEGGLGAQTLNGKTPYGVARIARRHGVPVIAVAGSLEAGWEPLYDHGITAVFSILTGVMTLDEALAKAEPMLADAGEAITRLWLAAKQST
ncbi:MAG: glycerate kinase [Candidatus Hydrogenedentes bacterium]|nr:glycerate kinase [Candidatus Hydrogenedentota bacterium]